MVRRTVLVVGGGGREHALSERLARCDSVSRVVVTPGNAGTAAESGASKVENHAGDPLDVARAIQADLVVVGPEQPLCDGLIDELIQAGFVAYGPSRRAAELEASKAFMKDFAARYEIPTARHITISSISELDAALARFENPPVIKAVGLCAGKGVIVPETFDQARTAAHAILEERTFGDAGSQVVIEERLVGREVSVHAICDGERAFVLPVIQDHKRLQDGDAGPNTGGMGTYGPPPFIDSEMMSMIESTIIGRVVHGMTREESPFRGTLFAGLMLTEQGPTLLEINVRFGDPETQVLMGFVDGDFAELLYSAALGRLEPSAVTLTPRSGLCVVLAAGGYPMDPRRGDVITGLEEAGQIPGVRVYHAGTRRQDGNIVTSGGRVLGVTASGATLAEAHQRAYQACDRIHFEGMQYRRDIGHQGLVPADG